jgi:hypothetical protein
MSNTETNVDRLYRLLVLEGRMLSSFEIQEYFGFNSIDNVYTMIKTLRSEGFAILRDDESGLYYVEDIDNPCAIEG